MTALRRPMGPRGHATDREDRMSEQKMPARIWAGSPSMCGNAFGDWDDTPSLPGDTEYRRADLPPTPAEAMRCHEVMALVEALRPFAEAAMHLHPATPNDATTLDGIDAGQWRAAYAALAALEQEARHE